jgi:hypothetical protein
MNAWFWSTVFHARDVRFTEIMDYLSAVFFVATGTAIAILKTFDLKKMKQRVVVFITFYVLYMRHVHYMLFVKFDYGWNVLLSVIIAVVGSMSWVYWIYKNRKPYSWKIIAAQIGLWFAASLEVFDFPPIFDVIDAHALWHGATIPIGFLWYSFVLDDCRDEEEKWRKRNR